MTSYTRKRNLPRIPPDLLKKARLNVVRDDVCLNASKVIGGREGILFKNVSSTDHATNDVPLDDENSFCEGESWFEKLDFEFLENKANQKVSEILAPDLVNKSSGANKGFRVTNNDNNGPGNPIFSSPKRFSPKNVKSNCDIVVCRPMLRETTNANRRPAKEAINLNPVTSDQQRSSVSPILRGVQRTSKNNCTLAVQLESDADVSESTASLQRHRALPNRHELINSQSTRSIVEQNGTPSASQRNTITSLNPVNKSRSVHSAFKNPMKMGIITYSLNSQDQTTSAPEKRSITRTIMNAFRTNSSKQSTSRIVNRSICEIEKDRSLEVALAGAFCLQDVDSQFGCGTFHGLPLIVKDLIKKYKGIDKLYDWQNECLNLNAVQNKTNLIYCLPTSGGKTLVAEILIWKELLCYHKNALLVLPYVSIVQQKISDMSEIALELGFFLEEYAGCKGQMPPRKHHQKPCVYIATIEKAHMLINCFLEEKRIQDIGLVVVDELHMIGESGGRGAILENMLTKLLFCPISPMIVGMSATIGNINDLKKFLTAEIYSGSFRPVELLEYVKLGNSIYLVNKKAKCDQDFVKLSRKLSFKRYTQEMMKQDKDCLAGLITEVIPQHSCLVFCPTKANCENVAKLVCKSLDKSIKEDKIMEKTALLDALALEGNGEMCPILRQIIPYGIAYHHGGLTMDERALLEQSYSAGTLCCLMCTSTLAAGVNLPAKRVIVRSPYIGRDFITPGKLKQMVGRAGRAGIDSSGESILIVPAEDEKKAGNLLKAPIERCTSTLLDSSRGLNMLLLSAIGLKLACTGSDIELLVSKTLLQIQNDTVAPDTFKLHTTRAMKNLKRLNLLKIVTPSSVDRHSSMDTCWDVTDLGKATFKGCIDLEWTEILYTDLKTGLKTLCLKTHLHLLYLVTPYHLVETVSPIPNVYYETYNRLSSDDLLVAKVIGVSEACIVQVATGQIKESVKAKVNRFYLTLILYDLWKQNSIWQVATKYKLPRGHVQNLLSSSASFATCVANFCKELGDLWAYDSLFPNFIQQLSHCVTMELIPLMDLPQTNRARARQLYNAGFKTLGILAQSNPQDLMQKIDHMTRKVAKTIVDTAKILILKKAEELQDQVEDLFAIK